MINCGGRRQGAIWLLVLLLTASVAVAEEDYRKVVIAEPYIELHTGPGRGYPVFHVIERGATVEILKRRTDWFKLRMPRGKEGWVHLEALMLTLNPAGEPSHFAEAKMADFSSRRWELGVLGGDFGGATLVSAYGGYALSENLSIELAAAQALGKFSSQYLAEFNLVAQPFPEWRISPFFTIGTGVIHTRPKGTLVQTEDRTDQTANAGLGARIYLTRRFILRAEVRNRLIFTSRDDNEELIEWKIGIGFFF